MTWLVLTAEVHNPQTKKVYRVKRRINFDLVPAYEPNDAGGTSLVILNAVHQVDETADQIDAALKDENHELRIREPDCVIVNSLTPSDVVKEAMSIPPGPRSPFLLRILGGG